MTEESGRLRHGMFGWRKFAGARLSMVITMTKVTRDMAYDRQLYATARELDSICRLMTSVEHRMKNAYATWREEIENDVETENM